MVDMKTVLKIIFTQCIMLIGLPLFAQKNGMVKSQKELCETKTDTADFALFKKEAEKQISGNRQKIALLKEKKLNASAKANKKFSKKILALENKNNELKKRMSECSSKPPLWLSFKSKFMRDLKQLGEALDDLAVDQYELSQ
jgi:hypothetical protein